MACRPLIRHIALRPPHRGPSGPGEALGAARACRLRRVPAGRRGLIGDRGLRSRDRTRDGARQRDAPSALLSPEVTARRLMAAQATRRTAGRSATRKGPRRGRLRTRPRPRRTFPRRARTRPRRPHTPSMPAHATQTRARVGSTETPTKPLIRLKWASPADEVTTKTRSLGLRKRPAAPVASQDRVR